uniref:Galectin n=1 Tax=Spumella elongata TaxID=89044 RepID=A0A7S3GQD1_9STRA|mmetsp:Transcript_14036/g.24713  ORF Transcript_14036/g.24713 Transcript_14036/m.24713 type:complete len:480 (+) Transcript_14036:1-1440(+)
MAQQDQVELTDYHGRWLTEAEILLSRFFEQKHEDRANELRAKKMEREIMARSFLTATQQSMDNIAKQKKIAPPEIVAPPPSAPTKEQKREEVPDRNKKEQSSHSFVPSNQDSTPMEVDEEPSLAPTLRVDSKPTKTIKKKNVIDESALQEAADAQSNLDPENLFSSVGVLHDTIWKSNVANSTPLSVLLKSFSYTQKQTIGLKLTVPNDSTSWSLNICAGKDWHNNNILLHFNPRYKKRTVVTNDKQGTWGAGRSRQIGKESSSKNDGLLAKDIDLMIQLRADGFYIFANDMFSDFFPHRRDPTTVGTVDSTNSHAKSNTGMADLKVIVNDKDANGNVQDIIVHQVWWGRRDPSHNPLPKPVQAKASRVAQEEKELISRSVPFSQRSLLIRGLPMGQFDLVECQAIEFALQDVFAEFGVEDVSVIPGHGYAFMRLSDPSKVKPSIEELNGATIVLTEAAAGTEGKEEEGSTLEITPMNL